VKQQGITKQPGEVKQQGITKQQGEAKQQGIIKQQSEVAWKGGQESKGVEGGRKTVTWDMTEGGGEINGREYSQHAMERMAPDTP